MTVKEFEEIKSQVLDDPDELEGTCRFRFELLKALWAIERAIRGSLEE